MLNSFGEPTCCSCVRSQGTVHTYNSVTNTRKNQEIFLFPSHLRLPPTHYYIFIYEKVLVWVFGGRCGSHLLKWATKALPATLKLIRREPTPLELQHKVLGQPLSTALWETTQDFTTENKCLDNENVGLLKGTISYFLRVSLWGTVWSAPQSEM